MHGPLEKFYGAALDLVASFMNHSCDPNAHAFFEGTQLRVRSLKPIQAGDEITLAYVDPKTGVMMRRELLSSNHFFACKCKSKASTLSV